MKNRDSQGLQVNQSDESKQYRGSQLQKSIFKQVNPTGIKIVSQIDK